MIAVADLAEAAEELDDRYGLVSIEGGRHPGWGTANRIVPLGESYLELIAVVDQEEAARSAFGRWISHAEPGQPLGWAVRTRELDAVARRLGLSADAGSRVAPDGTLLQWRSAGKDKAVAEPSLPFFIEWGPNTKRPGRSGPVNARLDQLVLTGDASPLASWLGEHALPIVVRPGTPAVAAVVLTGAGSEIVLGDPYAVRP